MLNPLITPYNALMAARCLMEFDIQAIKKPHERDIPYWGQLIQQLEQHYQQFLHDEALSPVEQQAALQRALTQLAETLRLMSSLLSEEAKQQLQTLLTQTPGGKSR